MVNLTLKLTFIIFLSSNVTLSAAQNTKGNADVFVIADLSGSMYQRMDGVRRLDLLKGPVNSFLQTQFKDQNIHLIRFGVKSRNCNSLEHFEALTPEGLDQKIKASIPKPYAQTALRPALDLLLTKIKSDKPTKIFIVSDGENTCGESPCAAISKIKEKNKLAAFDVLLLGENAKAKEQLSCIGADIRTLTSPEGIKDILSELASRKTPGLEDTKPAEMGALRIRNLDDFEPYSAKMIKSFSKKLPVLTSVESSQGENVLPLMAGTYLVTVPKYSAVVKAIIRPGLTTELDFYTAFNLPPASVKVHHPNYPGEIRFTMSSGRGRENTSGAWIDAKPGKNSIRFTHPESLAGMMIAGLHFEPRQNYEYDLSELVGVYQNPNSFLVILRNLSFFDDHSNLKPGNAFLLLPSATLPMPPGSYAVEKSSDTIANIDLALDPLRVN
jgi:hypothetical protein